MAWISVEREADAGDELREAYARVASARGRVANILTIHSVSPRAMTTHLELYRQLMFGRSELVDYALKLTKAPDAVGPLDVAALRSRGLGDAAIHDAACVAAYFNFVNRIALGLGVELVG